MKCNFLTNMKNLTKLNNILRLALVGSCVSMSPLALADQLPNLTYSFGSGNKSVSGSATDPDHPGTVRIGAWIDGVSVGTIYASGGAYTFNIPSQYWDGKSHSLALHAVNIEPDGSAPGSPVKTIGPIAFTAYSKPTASLSWSPSTVSYSGTSTLQWSSNNAVNCYHSGNKYASSGHIPYSNRTASQTISMYCEGPGGKSSTVSATLNVLPPNKAPSVNVSVPASHVEGSAINATANASDQDGSVSKVRFQVFPSGNSGNVISQLDDNSAPYGFNMTGLPAGSYTVKATAFDNQNLSSAAQANFTVNKAPRPLSFNGLSFTPNPALVGQPQTFSFQYENAVKCFMDHTKNPRWSTSVTYVDSGNDEGVSGTYTWTSAPRTTAESWVQTVSCIAEDGSIIDRSVSNVIQGVANIAPVVSDVAVPTEGLAGEVIDLSAVALDSDGTISNVTFIVSALQTGAEVTRINGISESQGRYIASVSLSSGQYVLRVEATDNSGATNSLSSTTQEFSVKSPSSPQITELSYYPNPAQVGQSQTFTLSYQDVYSCWMDPDVNPRWDSRVDYVTNNGTLQTGTFKVQTGVREKEEGWVQTVKCLGANGEVIQKSTQNVIELASGENEVRAVSIANLQYEPATIQVGESQVFSFSYENARTCYMDADDNPAWDSDVIYINDDGTLKSGHFSVTTAKRTEPFSWDQTVSCIGLDGSVVKATAPSAVEEGLAILNAYIGPNNPSIVRSENTLYVEYVGANQCFGTIADGSSSHTEFGFDALTEDKSGVYEFVFSAPAEPGEYQTIINCRNIAGQEVTSSVTQSVEAGELEPVSFQWSAVDGATGYNIRIKGNESNELVDEVVDNTNFSSYLPFGNYSMVLNACITNQQESRICSGVSESVSVGFTITDSSVTALTNQIVSDLIQFGFDSVYYKDDRFVAVFDLSSVADESAIGKVQFRLNSGAWVDAVLSNDGYIYDFGQLSVDGYNLEVRILDAFGNEFSGATQFDVESKMKVASPELPSGPASFETSLLKEQNYKRLTDSSFRVNESGAASYSVNIFTPKLGNQPSPSLGLVYNSNGANGPLGKGWSISGISEIARCHGQPLLTGSKSSVEYTQSDELCLSGVPLIKFGNTYRVLGDQDTKVTLEGSNIQSSTAYFSASRSDGLTYEYRRLVKTENGITYRWLLSAIKDKFNNAIAFTYDSISNSKDSHSVALSKVIYSGYEVEFVYEANPFPRSSYQLGNLVSIDKRLNLINVKNKVKGQIRSYSLDYLEDSFTRSNKLQTITMCGFDDNSCTDPITFAWSEASHFVDVSLQTQNLDLSKFGTYKFGVLSALIPGDIDNDGDMDLAYAYRLPPDSLTGEFPPETVFILLRNNDGFYSKVKQWVTVDPKLRDNYPGRPSQIVRFVDTNLDGVLELQMFGLGVIDTGSLAKIKDFNDFSGVDINGDGFADYVRGSVDSDAEQGVFKAELGGENAKSVDIPIVGVPIFFPPSGQEIWRRKFYVPISIDLNGDSLRDGIITTAETVYEPQDPQDPYLAPPQVYYQDVLVTLKQGESGLYYEYVDKVAPTEAERNNINIGYSTRRTVDLNGDGLSDFYITSNHKEACVFSTGLGVTYKESCGRTDYQVADAKHASLVDVNGDGMTDYVYYKGAFRVRLGKGDGTFESSRLLQAKGIENISADIDQVTFYDIDNSGVLNGIVVDGSRLKIYTGNGTNADFNKIVKVTENEVATEINYTNSSNRDVVKLGDYQWAKSRSFADGYRVANSPAVGTVVSSVTSDVLGLNDNNVPQFEKYRLEYFYKGGRYQAGGQGSLGFEYVSSFDPQRKLLTQNKYSQEKFKVGLPLETKSYHLENGYNGEIPSSNGTLVSNSNREYYVLPIHGGQNYVSLMKRSRDFKRAPTGQLIKSSEIVNTFVGVASDGSVAPVGVPKSSEYTLISKVNSYVRDGNNKLLETLVTTNIYGAENPSVWSINRVTQSEAEKTTSSYPNRRGSASQKEISKFSYDNNGILISESSRWGTQLQFNSLYCYNAKGENILNVTYDNNFSPTCENAESLNPSRTLENFGKVYQLQKQDFVGGRVVRKYDFDLNIAIETADSNFNRLNVPNSDSDISGVVTHYIYDDFGLPTGSYTNAGNYQLAQAFDISVGGMNSVLPSELALVADYYVLTSSSGDPSEVTIYSKDGSQIGRGTVALDGRWKFSANFSDALGREILALDYDLNNVVTNKQVNVYDAFDQMTGATSYGPGNAVVSEMTFENEYRADGYFLSSTSSNYFNSEGILSNEHKSFNVSSPFGRDTLSSGTTGTVKYYHDVDGNLVVTKLIEKQATSLQDAYLLATTESEPIYSYHVITRDEFGRATKVEEKGTFTETMEYDALDRVISVSNPDYTVRTYFTNSGAEADNIRFKAGDLETVLAHYRTEYNDRGLKSAICKFEGVIGSSCSTSDNKTLLDYDEFGRVSSETTLFEGITNTVTKYYDEFGRKFKILDGSYDEAGIKYNYNRYNYRTSVEEARYSGSSSDKVVYSENTSIDDFGNIDNVKRMNGSINLSFVYDHLGRVKRKLATNKFGEVVQNTEFEYDGIGNLLKHSRGDLAEDFGLKIRHFGYDDANRLTSYGFGNSPQNKQTYTRYGLGNRIEWRSGVGSYCYDELGFDTRVSSVGGSCGGDSVYRYNARGSVTYDGVNTIKYTAFDKVESIVNGENGLTFSYAANDALVKKISRTGSEELVTYRLGGVDIVFKSGVVVATKRIIPGGVQQLDKSQNISSSIYLTDNLGNTEVEVDEKGLVKERTFTSPTGKQSSISQQFWSSNRSYGALLVDDNNGFTGHDNYEQFSIVNMKGRIYSSNTGLFLQQDPIVALPSEAISHNRYIYAYHNPLVNSDPTGNLNLKRFVKKHSAQLIITALTAGWGGGAGSLLHTLGVENLILQGAIIGATRTAFLTGFDGSATLNGAFSGAAFGGVGEWTPGGVWGQVTKVGLHGAVGGISSKLQGGKFAHGFVSAAVTEALTQTGAFDFVYSGSTDFSGRLYDAIGGGLVGGLVSDVSGGSFRNGFTTASFSRLLNHSNHNHRDSASTLRQSKINSLRTDLSDFEVAFVKFTKSMEFDTKNLALAYKIHNESGDAMFALPPQVQSSLQDQVGEYIPFLPEHTVYKNVVEFQLWGEQGPPIADYASTSYGIPLKRGGAAQAEVNWGASSASDALLKVSFSHGDKSAVWVGAQADVSGAGVASVSQKVCSANQCGAVSAGIDGGTMTDLFWATMNAIEARIYQRMGGGLSQ